MDYPLVSVTIDNQVVKRPCIFTHEQIEHAIDVIAYDIVTRFDKHKHLNQARPITLVAIKNGGVRFAEALYDRLCRDARVDVSYTTVSVTSYKDRKSSGHLVWREKYSIPLPGRILILCDDLADTFITLNDLEKYTMNLRKHPDAVYTAVLISKPSAPS